MQQRESGFTLIELLVVLMLVTVIVSMTQFSFEPLSERSDERAQIASAIRKLQNCAIQAQKNASTVNCPIIEADTSADQTVSQFFADGSSNGAGVSIETSKGRRHLQIDPLTSQVTTE